MSKQRDALQAIAELADKYAGGYPTQIGTIAREALAEPESKPVAWLYELHDSIEAINAKATVDRYDLEITSPFGRKGIDYAKWLTVHETPLYTSPPERKTTIQPIAWRWMHNGVPDSEKCFDGPGPSPEIIALAAAAEFPRTVQYFYAAPHLSNQVVDDLLKTLEQIAWSNDSKWQADCARAAIIRAKENL